MTKKYQYIIFQVDPEFKNKLVEVAEIEGRSISSLVRKIISDHLNKQYCKNENIN